MQQLCLASETGGTHLGPLGQIRKMAVFKADHGIAGVSPLGNGCNDKTLRHLCGHVLQTVHRNVDAP